MAATGLIDGPGPRGDVGAPGGGNMQVQTPPQWRQIRAATPSPPHRERSASPPASKEKDGRRGYNDQEYNQAHMRIGRGDTGCPSRPHRDRSADGPERQAASRQDRFGGQHDFRPNQPKGDGYWRSPDWQRDTQRHANHIPLEGHHDHRGPETPCFSSGSDRYGRGAIAKKIQVSWDEEGREKDRGFEQYADHNSRDDGGDWARHEGDRDQYSSAASGRFGLSYNQVDSEPSYLLQRSPRSEHQAREPLDSGSGTSSDRRSRGSDKTSHTGDRRGKGKRVELSNGLGRRQTAQKTQAPISSVRRQLPSPRTFPPQSDGSPSKVHNRAKVSPARHRLSPVDIEDAKPKPESRNEALVKSPKDMLLFSKKARHVEYKPCTLKEYRETKPTGYVELGKLQPDLYTDELVAKRANAERIKEFSANLRKINSDTAAATRRGGGGGGGGRPRKDPAPQDARSKGLAFASRIPLPKKRQEPPHKKKAEPEPGFDPADPRARGRASRRGSGQPPEEGWRSRELTELEALEREHDDMRRKVQAARSVY